MPLTGLDANVLGGMKQVNIVQIKKEHWQEKFRYFYPSNSVNCLSTGTRIDYDSFCRYRSMPAFRRAAWKRHKRKKHAAHYRLEWLFCGALKVDGSVTRFRLMMKSKEQPRTTPNTKLSPQGGLVSGFWRDSPNSAGIRVLVQKTTDTTERSALRKNTYKVTSHREQ